MNRREYHIGPGAALLMLVVVVLSMSVLALLAFTSARSDVNMSVRSVRMTELAYQAQDAAEYTIAELDAYLAECAAASADDAEYMRAAAEKLDDRFTLDGRNICWQEAAGENRVLQCGIRISEYGVSPHWQWSAHWLESSAGGMGEDFD